MSNENGYESGISLDEFFEDFDSFPVPKGGHARRKDTTKILLYFPDDTPLEIYGFTLNALKELVHAKDGMDLVQLSNACNISQSYNGWVYDDLENLERVGVVVSKNIAGGGYTSIPRLLNPKPEPLLLLIQTYFEGDYEKPRINPQQP